MYIHIYIEIEWYKERKRSLVTFHRGAVYDYRFAFRQQAAWIVSVPSSEVTGRFPGPYISQARFESSRGKGREKKVKFVAR